AKRLTADLEMVHIRVGDIFRWHVQSHAKLSARIRRIIAAGELVPDDTTMVLEVPRPVEPEEPLPPLLVTISVAAENFEIEQTNRAPGGVPRPDRQDPISCNGPGTATDYCGRGFRRRKALNIGLIQTWVTRGSSGRSCKGLDSVDRECRNGS